MPALKIYVIFVLTYAGITAGRLPWWRVDRTGIALLGLIALVATGTLTLDEVGARIDMSTLVLLFALMIVSAQFVTAGSAESLFARFAKSSGTPEQFLGGTVALSGVLSAFVANDIMLYVTTPLLVDLVRRRGLDPRPYLIAFIAASNAGSAATIIGAPQTIVIGQLGNLLLPTYLLECAIPSGIAMVIVYGVVRLMWHGRFALAPDPFRVEPNLPPLAATPHDPAQTRKGLIAIGVLLLLFCTSLPKDLIALFIAALLLLNRKVTSSTMIGTVDWPLLLLVTCLFGVTGAVASTAGPGMLIDFLQDHQLLPDSLAVLTPLTLLVSCTIGSVPFSILLLQIWPDAPPGALGGLALLSSLAGNLFLISSLSNVIIASRAGERGVHLGFWEFTKVGAPITVLSMAVAVFWVWLTGFMPFLPATESLP
jgi:Na+/H+ antiporter NhaD/arsenite permease-like protein